jgi:lincosamide nucleotidyltransferase A/C/D/E
MTADDVGDFYRQMRNLGIDIWLDGGWGVDALLGRQTRAHADLDIIVQEKDLTAVVGFLADHGFRECARADSRAWNFVMGDDRGRLIDFHVIVFDDRDNGLYGPQDDGVSMYPAAALQGRGVIAGLAVKCVSAGYQIDSHTGYAFDETDYRDVCALAQAFGLAVPQVYRERFGVTPPS